MGNYYILGIRVNHRHANAIKLQELLTKHGCHIKMRVGVHETSDEFCSDDGLIVLQVCGNTEETNEMIADFDSLEGVTARMLDLN